jgi:tryptophan-rich sensory protein
MKDTIAAALMLPYLAWGTYAFALNLSVWQRNRDGAVPA